MHAFNSEGVYVLFETGSPEPTRTWSREVYDCNKCIDCPITKGASGNLYAEKLKYVVLKNPPSTAPPPKKLGVVSRDNTILVNNVLFKVDSQVFPYLGAYTINSCDELTNAIAEIRMVHNLPTPIGVKLASVPLTQYITKRVYPAGNDTRPGQYVTKRFNYPYKLSEYYGTTEELEAAIQSYKANNLYLFFVLDNAKVFNAVNNNNNCEYTPLIDDFYGTSSVWGKHILATSSIQLYKETGVKTFDPIWVVLTSPTPWIYNGNYQNSVGLLVPINGQVVFVPMYNPSSTYNVLPNIAVSVLISSTNEKLFALRVQQLAINTSVHYKLLTPAK